VPTATAATAPAAFCTPTRPMPRATSWSTSTRPTTRRARSPRSRPAPCRRRTIALTSRFLPGRRSTPGDRPGLRSIQLPAAIHTDHHMRILPDLFRPPLLAALLALAAVAEPAPAQVLPAAESTAGPPVVFVPPRDPPLPLLWQVSDADNTVYLLGSFHLLRADDYPLSSDV